MSTGPTGDGVSYWATIKISKKLDKDQLKAVVNQITAILQQNQGSIEAEARVSDHGNPSFSFAFKKPGGP
jgi:hypothetical protein